jgi:multiple sugar transport system ATP-binding protein
MARVLLEHVWKYYAGDKPAVTDFNLEVADKEFMVFVGPSGCGKSTTLRMIAGLEEVSKGTIKIGERTVNNVPPKNRDIAMVFQNYALYPHMTVYENMAFGLRLRKYRKQEIDARVREAAEILGMSEYLKRRPKELSGGQRQRVAVGRAIVRKPAVFLFDEPLSNLDAKMRVQMRAEICKLHAQLESTMIYVTHDQIEAMTMADRIAVMKDGLIQQVATPIELYDQPANLFAAGFIGTPPMNFFKGHVCGMGELLWFDADTFRVAVPQEMATLLGAYLDKATVLGIRPEHVGSPIAEADAGAVQISATVELREPMGSETHVHLKSGEHGFIAKVDPHHAGKMDERVSIALMPSKFHFFDPQTANRIG